MSYTTVWTIQDNKTWFTDQYNKKEGYYFASWDTEKSYQSNDRDGENTAYNWLRKELPNKIENYSGDAPIWARIKPVKLREYMRGHSGRSDWIIIKAKVPDSRVLLSCYSKWHIPLNRGGFYEDLDNDDGYRSKTLKENQATWKHIFDITNNNKWLTDGYGKAKIQACIDRIYDHEIISTHRIVGRKRRKLDYVK